MKKNATKTEKTKPDKTKQKKCEVFPFSLFYVYIDFYSIDKNSHILFSYSGSRFCTLSFSQKNK